MKIIKASQTLRRRQDNGLKRKWLHVHTVHRNRHDQTLVTTTLEYLRVPDSRVRYGHEREAKHLGVTTT